MKKIGIGLLALGIIFATSFFIKSNKKDVTIYETTQLKKETIQTKIVATGKVIPEDEVEIKPQIAGIIDKILVKEGDQVVLHPLADIEEAQEDVGKFLSESSPTDSKIIVRNQAFRTNLEEGIQ